MKPEFNVLIQAGYREGRMLPANELHTTCKRGWQSVIMQTEAGGECPAAFAWIDEFAIQDAELLRPRGMKRPAPLGFSNSQTPS